MNKLLRLQTCANPKFEMTYRTVNGVADNLDSCAPLFADCKRVQGNIYNIADKFAKEFVRLIFSEIRFGHV